MVRKAIFWSFASQFASLAIQFTGSIVIARLLSPREMGVYAVAMAATGILQLFTAFGVGAYVVREKELTPGVLDTAFTVNAILSTALGVILFASSWLFAIFLRERAVAQVLQLLAITPILSLFTFRPVTMLQRAMMFRGASLLNTVSAFLTSSVTIAAAVVGASYMSPAYGAVASGLFSAIGFSVVGREHVSLRVSTTGWRRMAAFGLRIMSIGGISVAAVRLGDIILGRFLGLDALGLYSRATNLTNLIFQNVYGTATRVIFAQLSAAQRDHDRVSAVFLRGFRIIVGLIGPIIIGLAVLARPAVYTMYGQKWLGAATPLSLLLIGQFISLGFAMNWELFVIRDEMKTQTRLEIIRSVLGVVTQTLGSLFNLTAVAATSIFNNLVSLGLYGRHMQRLAGTTTRDLTSMYLEAMLLTALAAGPSLALMVWSGWSARVSLSLVFASIALGGGLWATALVRLSHPLYDEARLIFDRIRSGLSPRARAVSRQSS